MDKPAPLIECRGLWKIYGNRQQEALRHARERGIGKAEMLETYDCVLGVADASFSVSRGETLCIMGLSGSGKSTLLRHVNRLIEPTAGELLVDGRNVLELDERQLRELRSRTMGMVFQHMALWPHRTIRDNVAYGLEVRKVDRKERYRVAEEALAQVKLDGWHLRYPDELSGGMQQRVGLARALALNPEILLMDEPFSALDPLIRRELQDEFMTLTRATRRTTLFITHDLEEAMRMGDRVAIMKDGVIVQEGTPEEIVTRPQGDYVERFVATMPGFKFLKAADLVDRGASGDAPLAGEVEAAATPLDVLRLLEGSTDRVAVVADGVRTGVITAASILAALQRDLIKTAA